MRGNPRTVADFPDEAARAAAEHESAAMTNTENHAAGTRLWERRKPGGLSHATADDLLTALCGRELDGGYDTEGEYVPTADPESLRRCVRCSAIAYTAAEQQAAARGIARWCHDHDQLGDLGLLLAIVLGIDGPGVPPAKKRRSHRV